MIDWQPIETAPKERLYDDEHTALVYCEDHEEYGVCWFEPDIGIWTSDGGDNYCATHWAPLSPPNAKSTKR